MDALLDRLWELANEEDEPRSGRRDERIAEARALWRALEVLLTALKPQELVVGDGMFTKLLACVRSVLSDPSYWAAGAFKGTTSNAGGDSSVSVFVCVNRVLLKVGTQGEREREALVRDGVADLIVCCGESVHQKFILSASEAAAALQTLQSFAMDSKNRPSLQVSNTIRLCIALMQKHSTAFAVQLRACQFLHHMAPEEDCKERIGRHGGLEAVTTALTRFAEEAELVATALDILFFLCVELEYQEEAEPAVPFRIANAAVLQGVVSAVVSAMRALQSVEMVQANGVAVLNSLVMHPPVKQVLCSINIWDIAENGLSTTAEDEAACDFIELLEMLLRDPVTYESLRQMLTHPPPNAQEGVTKSRLKALKSQVEDLRHSQVGSQVRMTLVENRLQSLLDEEVPESNAAVLTPSAASVDTSSIDYEGYGQFISSMTHPPVPSRASTHSEYESGDELPVDSAKSPSYMNDIQGDDGLLLDESSGYFEQFLRETQLSSASTSNTSVADAAESTPVDQLDALCKTPYGARICAKVHSAPAARNREYSKLPDWENDAKKAQSAVTTPKSESWRALYESNAREAKRVTGENPRTSDGEAQKWQALHEASAREVERVRSASREMEDRFQIALRRAKEQTKLLALQNARIGSHANEHQQVLRRMHSLEMSLEEADRRCQVERALRSAEATQCEQLSLALSESMREAKALAVEQSSAVRELQQKETLRTEYMMRTRESKQDKQRLEIERDNALLQIEILKHEKAEILEQLDDCRREGFESLSMREEDVDARRLGIFTELAKAAATQSGQRRGGSFHQMPGLTRRNSLPTETLVGHLSDSLKAEVVPTFLHRSASVYPIQTSTGSVDPELNADPNSIGTAEIQSCLSSVFRFLHRSVDGASEDGVHVSTVRRFFLECGLVQAPHVRPADIDVMLASVLAQCQLNRKNTLVRKDFATTSARTWSPPHGWAKKKRNSSPTKSKTLAADATRFRFFNQDAFNEAVTLVGMRRFPRSDLLRVLQTVVALYLRPYMSNQQTQGLPKSSTSCGLSRRSSTGAGSPSQVCSRAMRAILNGLALHIGHGNEHEHLRSPNTSGIEEGETRRHLNPPSSSGRSHKREDVVYSMLEMNRVLTREQRPLGTICEFYGSQHLPNAVAAATVSITKSELFGLSFELVLNFAVDFELIPSFMDRVSLKHLHAEVAGLVKAYFALHDKEPPTGADAETLKKVAFAMILARLAMELFCTKLGFETPEQQITGLLQWLDNSPGREKIMRKAGIPLVIRFSRQLYAVKT